MTSAVGAGGWSDLFRELLWTGLDWTAFVFPRLETGGQGVLRKPTCVCMYVCGRTGRNMLLQLSVSTACGLPVFSATRIVGMMGDRGEEGHGVLYGRWHLTGSGCGGRLLYSVLFFGVL